MVLVREGLGRVCEFRRYEVRGFPSAACSILMGKDFVMLATMEISFQNPELFVWLLVCIHLLCSARRRKCLCR